MRAEIEQPQAAARKDSVAVDPGTIIVLRADSQDPAASWRWQERPEGAGKPLPIPNKTPEAGKVEFVMDKDGRAAGSYFYEIGQKESTKVTISRRKGLVERLLRGALPVVIVVAAYSVAVGLVVADPWGWGADGWPLTGRALVFAVMTLVLALVLVALAARLATDQKGLAGLFLGADRRTSTSKVQYLLWTFGMAFALSYIGGRVLMGTGESFVCEPSQKTNCVPSEDWDAYLILLGVPAATAVIAKGVVSYKVLNGQTQKTQAPEAKFADVATNDNGQADLADIQYLLFNVIAFAFVAVNFIRTGALVTVPSILLGLTSAAAATYVLNKSLQTDKPVISSVAPSVIAPETKIVVRGQNLFPPSGSDTDPVIVKIGGVVATNVRIVSKDSVEATAPDGISTADPTVRVITAAQIETESYPVTILGGLALMGFATSAQQPSAPRPDEDGAIRVEGLPPTPQDVWVVFDSLSVEGKVEDGVVKVHVPSSLSPSGAVDVSVGVNGRWSPTKQLTLGT